jgi:hypothetical protein
MDWPKGAQSAKIELWCKRVKTEVGKTVTVRDINRNGLNLSLADARDVRIEIQTMPATQAEPLRLVVTEIHPEGTRNMNALKVELNSPVPAKKITRRFSEKCQVAQQPYHMAKHTFLLDNIRDSNEIQDYQLLFTPQSAIKQDAMHSGELTVALDVK